MKYETILTDEQIEEIRIDYANGISIKEMAKKWKIGEPKLNKILNREPLKRKNIMRQVTKNFDDTVNKNRVAIEKAKQLFNSLQIGQHLILNHKDDKATTDNNSKWSEINCHDAEIIYKTNHFITVKEPNGKKQSISFNQILSRAVIIQKGA